MAYMSRCFHCGARFQAETRWQRTCSAKCKKFAKEQEDLIDMLNSPYPEDGHSSCDEMNDDY